MNEISSRTLTLVWVLLMAATALSGWLAGSTAGTRLAATVILLLASLKILFIMRYFMELKFAPLKWRFAFHGWLLALTLIVLWGHWIAPT